MNKHNVQSVAIAKLGAMVAGMMAGKKSRVKPEDFLPFDTSRIAKEDGISQASMIVLLRLLKTKRLDGRVLSMLVDEIKQASFREKS